MDNEVKKPVWNPINLDVSSNSGDVGNLTDDVLKQLEQELRGITGGNDALPEEDKEILQIAKLIPKEELREIASKHALREQLGWVEREKQIEGGEKMNEINEIKEGLGEIKDALRNLISVLAPRVSEPPKVEEKVSMPDEKKQEVAINTDEPIKQVTAETKSDDNEIAKRVVEKPRQEEIKYPKEEAKQTAPIVSEETVEKSAQKKIAQEAPTKIPNVTETQDRKSSPPGIKEDVSISAPEVDEKIIKDETTTPSILPDAQTVVKPSNPNQTTPICAKFKKGRRLEDSTWTVYKGKNPVFAVTLKDVYDDWKEYADYFTSKDYGKDLIREIKSRGIIGTLEKHYGGGRFARVFFAQPTSDSRAVDFGEPDEGIGTEEVERKLNAPIEMENSIDETALAELLALYYFEEGLDDPDEYINTLKEILTKKESFDKLSGAIKTKIEEFEKADERADERVDKENKDNEPAIVAMLRRAQSNSGIRALIDYIDRLKGESEFVEKSKKLLKDAETKIGKLQEELAQKEMEDKKRKASILIEAMEIRGMIKPEEKTAKFKELVSKSSETLETLAEEISKMPVKKAKLLDEKPLEELPIAGSEETSYLRVLDAVSKMKVKDGIFSKPPKVDIKNKEIIEEGTGSWKKE